MGLLANNINDVKNLVHFGTRSDICLLCRREVAAQDRNQSLPEIDGQLRGKLAGQRVFKTRHSGADLVICMDHIKQIAEMDEEKTQTKKAGGKK